MRKYYLYFATALLCTQTVFLIKASTSYAESKDSLAKSVPKKLFKVHDDLTSIYFQVRFPNHQRSVKEAVRPTFEDVRNEASKLFDVKQSLETVLNTDNGYSLDQKILLIASYFKTLSLLTQNWLMFHGISNQAWIAYWSLTLNQEYLDIAEAISRPTDSITGGLSRTTEAKLLDNKIGISLSHEFILGLSLTKELSKQPSEAMGLLARTLGIQQLLKNKALIQLLTGVPSNKNFEIPKGYLTAKLPQIRADLLYTEKDQITESLLIQYTANHSVLYLNDTRKNILNDHLEKIKPLLNVKAGFSIQDTLSKNLTLKYKLSLEANLKLKNNILTQLVNTPITNAHLLLKEIFDLSFIHVLAAELDVHQNNEDLSLNKADPQLQKLTSEFISKITTTEDKAYFGDLLVKIKSQITTGHGSQLYLNLKDRIQKQLSTLKNTEEQFNNSPVNLQALNETLSHKEFFGFSHFAQEEFASLQINQDYLEVRKEYFNALFKYLCELDPDLNINFESTEVMENLVNGQTQVHSIIKKINSTPYEKLIQDEIDRKQVSKLQSFLAFGVYLGFGEYKTKAPTAFELTNYIKTKTPGTIKAIYRDNPPKQGWFARSLDFTFGKSLIKRYKTNLENQIIDLAPILDVTVMGEKLKTRLVSLNLKDPYESSIADFYIHKALTEQLKITDKQITRLATTEDPIELEAILESNVFSEQVYSSLPFVKYSKTQFLISLKSQSEIEKGLRRFNSLYLGGGFTALIVLQLSNWSAKKLFKPIAAIEALMTVMGPEVNAFMRTATLVSAGDMVLHSRDFFETRNTKKTTEELFYTSVISPTFKSKSQLEEAKKQADFEAYFYAGRVVLDGAFMYYPFLAGHMRAPK